MALGTIMFLSFSLFFKAIFNIKQIKRALVISFFALSIVGCGGGSSGPNNNAEGYGFIKSYGTPLSDDVSAVTKELKDGTLITAGSYEDGTPWIGKMDAEGNLYDQFALQPSIKTLHPTIRVAADGRRLVSLPHSRNTVAKMQLQNADQTVIWTKEYPYDDIRGVTSDYTVKSTAVRGGEINTGFGVLLATAIDAVGSDGNSFYMVMTRYNLNVRNDFPLNPDAPKHYSEHSYWVQKVSALTGDIIWRSDMLRQPRSTNIGYFVKSSSGTKNFVTGTEVFDHGSRKVGGYFFTSPLGGSNGYTYLGSDFRFDIKFNDNDEVSIDFKGYTYPPSFQFAKAIPDGFYIHGRPKYRRVEASEFQVDVENVLYSSTGIKLNTITDNYVTRNNTYPNDVRNSTGVDPTIIEESVATNADEKTSPLTKIGESGDSRFSVTDVTELDNGTIIAVLSPGHFASSKIIVALRDAQILWSKNLYESLAITNLLFDNNRYTDELRDENSSLVHTEENQLRQTEAQLESLPNNEFVVFLDGVLLKFNGLTGSKIWERTWKDNKLTSDPLFNESLFDTSTFTPRYNDQIGGRYSFSLPSINSSSGDFRSNDNTFFANLSVTNNKDILISMPVITGSVINNPTDNTSQIGGIDHYLFVVRVGQDGKEVWRKALNFQPSSGSKMVEMPNGNILLVTSHRLRSVSYKKEDHLSVIYLTLLDPQGNVISHKNYKTLTIQL